MGERAEAPRDEFAGLGAFYKLEIEPWLAGREGERRRARGLQWLIVGGGIPLLMVIAGGACLCASVVQGGKREHGERRCYSLERLRRPC